MANPEDSDESQKCPKCGSSFVSNFEGEVCHDCTLLIKRVNEFELKLNKEGFEIEKEDEEIAKQIHELLIEESVGVSEQDEEKDDRLLNELTDKLAKNEERSKSILTEIRKLQKQKTENSDKDNLEKL